MRSFFFTTLLSSSLISLVLAGPQISPYAVHERRSRVPHGWYHSHKHHANAVIPLRFGLSQSNIDNIEDYLNDVSEPTSPNFGKHWSPIQVAAAFAPSDESVDTVRTWLIDSGFTRDRVRVTPTKGWIEVNATVEEAERLLLTEYHVYQHDSGSHHICMRCRFLYRSTSTNLLDFFGSL